MMAFNRLDEAAEIHYEVEPLRDGFFVRDDVPGDFWQMTMEPIVSLVTMLMKLFASSIQILAVVT